MLEHCFSLIKFCSSLSFLFKTFFSIQKKITSNFIYKPVNCPQSPNTLTSLLFYRISKLSDFHGFLLLHFLKHVTCFNVFFTIFLLHSDCLWFFIKGWHYSKCHKKLQFDDKGRCVFFYWHCLVVTCHFQLFIT